MKNKLLAGMVVSLLKEITEHNIEKVFAEEWIDVTNIIKFPSLRSLKLRCEIDSGHILKTKYNGRTYCKKDDIMKVYGSIEKLISRH